MAHAPIMIKAYFLEYGKNAPGNSEYKGLVTEKTMFGTGYGFSEYTARKESIQNSIQTDSFIGYTGREWAVSDSADQYFTMSERGKLFSKEDRKMWADNAAKYFSKSGDLAWTMVISLEDYELLEKYGIIDQRDFANITNSALRKTFLRLHLDPDNMIWWEDYHTNTKHPHLHITFFEKEHTRDRGKLTPKELDAIKTIFITEMAARRTIVENYGLTETEILKVVHSNKKMIVEEAGELDFSTSEKIMTLYMQLPQHGRLQYNSTHMIPYRKQLDDIVDDILKIKPICDQYEQFKEKLVMLASNINELNNDNIASIGRVEDRKLRTQLANLVLKSFKDFDSLSIKELHKRRREEGLSIISDPDDPDLQEAMKYLSKNELSDYATGMQLVEKAAKNGTAKARYYLNNYRKHVHLTKAMFRMMKGSYGKELLREVKQVIREDTIAANQEIAAYLKNDSDIAAHSYEELETENYLKIRWD